MSYLGYKKGNKKKIFSNRVQVQAGEGFFIIDKEDMDKVLEHTWHIQKGRGKPIAVRSTKYLNGKFSVLNLHRFLLGDPEGLMVDHINRNPLDNRRKNLRAVTHSQNSINKIVKKKKHDLPPNITFRENRNYYEVNFLVNGKLKFIGGSKHLEIAMQIAKNASIEIHGEFSPYFTRG